MGVPELGSWWAGGCGHPTEVAGSTGEEGLGRAKPAAFSKQGLLVARFADIRPTRM